MNGMPMDPDILTILAELSPEELAEMFYPYQQEQGVLNQEMELAQGLRQRGPERSTPTGALLGGLANALGDIGGTALQSKGLASQRALGGRMQTDATNRMQALERLLRQRGAGGVGGYVGLDTSVA